MFPLQPRRDNPRTKSDTGRPLSRSRFLAWLALGSGALAGGLLSPISALARGRPLLSIGSTMPVVSKIGLFLGSATALKANQALAYTDPKTGDPALLIRLSGGKLVSFDVVCPHAGCNVAYDSGKRLMVCPCHGAQFDPARSAAPLSGPVSQPLISLPIRTDAHGNVYALDAKPGAKVNRLHAAPAPSQGGDDGNEAGDDGSGNTRRRKHGGDG